MPAVGPAGSPEGGDLTPSSVRASAPGKVILMGEHAVVYGRPAVIAALGRRATVEARRRDGSGVRARLLDLDRDLELGWGEVADHADRARRAWEAYAAQPGPETFAALGAEEPTHLVRTALGEVVREVTGPTGGASGLPGIQIEIRSGIPIGSGFGSSAAVGSALLAAALAVLGEEPEPGRLDRLALEVERRQHGAPSGVDHTTVQRGGLLAARRGEDGMLAVEPVAAAAALLERLSIWDTGPPAEPTGAVVAAVRRLRDRDPEDFEVRLGRMEADVEAFRRELAGGSPPRAAHRIRQYQRSLEALGVVPEPVQKIVSAVEALGGAAKISGAGSLAGPGAGSLLVFREPGDEDLTPALVRCRPVEAALGVEGLRIERV